jgi:hypothetical protein
MTTIAKLKSDNLGALASAICLVHCVATPFIFVSAASIDHHHHGASPFWWNAIDLVFLVISLAAIYWSVKPSTKTWMKFGLYSSWALLALLIFSEKLDAIHFPEILMYIPAFSLIVLHLYNKRHHQCEDSRCLI